MSDQVRPNIRLPAVARESTSSDVWYLDEAVIMIQGRRYCLWRVLDQDGTFSYDPVSQFEYLAIGETASDSLTYTVTDAVGESSTETVTITG